MARIFHFECSKCKTYTTHISWPCFSHLIEKARANDIRLPCLPAHCTLILQPLDVSVMGSLKSHIGKTRKQFLMQNPGRIITEGDLADLFGKAWPLALTPNDLISGFTRGGWKRVIAHHVNGHVICVSL